MLVDYAKNNDLYICGGSDYHGSSKPDIEIGTGRGDLSISKEILNWLQDINISIVKELALLCWMK